MSPGRSRTARCPRRSAGDRWDIPRARVGSGRFRCAEPRSKRTVSVQPGNRHGTAGVSPCTFTFPPFRDEPPSPAALTVPLLRATAHLSPVERCPTTLGARRHIVERNASTGSSAPPGPTGRGRTGGRPRPRGAERPTAPTPPAPGSRCGWRPRRRRRACRPPRRGRRRRGRAWCSPSGTARRCGGGRRPSERRSPISPTRSSTDTRVTLAMPIAPTSSDTPPRRRNKELRSLCTPRARSGLGWRGDLEDLGSAGFSATGSLPAMTLAAPMPRLDLHGSRRSRRRTPAGRCPRG